MRIVIMLILFTECMTIELKAQPFYFRHYQVENGLSNNSVFSIRQDTKGFMWFATKDGLNLFDGIHFKVFRINGDEDKKPLSTNYIFCLLPATDGKIWVGSQSGLYRFNTEKEIFEPFIDSLKNVFDITFDLSGQMWFISSNTVCRFNFSTGKLKKLFPSPSFNATSLCLSNHGQICVAGENGYLQIFNEKTLTFSQYNMFGHSVTSPSYWIQKIAPSDDNLIMVGTKSQGLKLFDLNTLTYKDLITYNDDGTTIYVRDILQKTKSEYWIATESGIFIYNILQNKFLNLKKKFLDPYTLNDNAIYSLCKDKEGGIWVGTFFGGVNYFANQNAAFRKYFPDNTTNTISGNAVREICKDKYGNLWVGTEDAGLNEIRKNSNQILRFKPSGNRKSIAYLNIHGLLADGDSLWISTFEHGIDIMDIKSGRIIKHFNSGPGINDLKSNFALCFIKASNGEIVIGSTNGLFFYNRDKNEFSNPKELPENLSIKSLVQDHQKIIWVGTTNDGAYWLDPKTHEHGHLKSNATNKNSLTNDGINDIFEDSKNVLWFATEGGGICTLSADRKTFANYTTKDNLPSNFIFKILEDKSNRIWATTSSGLVNVDRNFSSVTMFTQASGILNNQFNYHSGFKDVDGRIFFGSVKGMISFVPEEIVKNNYNPPVYITGIQVFNNEVSVRKDSSTLSKAIVYTDKIKLPYYKSSISVDFAALAYTAPEMTTYKFKLKGLDNDWTILKSNRKVYFTNLSPGTYTFIIRASNNNFVTNFSEKQLLIQILPPIWFTGPAYLLYCILIVGGLYYLISNYHKRQHERKEKEIYESKIDFFTIVAHEIKTPLTLIKGPVENLLEIKHEREDMNEDLACLERNTNRLVNLVSQMLDFRQTEIKKFTLDFSRVNVSETLRETFLSFKILAKKRKLNYELILPEKECFIYADLEALQKIISNLIGNAVKYAEKNVTITLMEISKDIKNMEILFENDGFIIPPEYKEKIFKAFYRIKETKQQKGTGIGLTLARSLAELHTGTLVLSLNKIGLNTFKLSIPIHPASEKRTRIIKNNFINNNKVK